MRINFTLWQFIVSMLILGSFILVFTLVGGWGARGDARMGAAVLAFLPVVAVTYILNSYSKTRLATLVIGFSAAAFGLFSLMSGWLSLTICLFIPAVAFGLVWDDLKRELTFESFYRPVWAGWLSLVVQFLAVGGTVLAAAYNLPAVFLVWLAVPVVGLAIFLVSRLRKRRQNLFKGMQNEH